MTDVSSTGAPRPSAVAPVAVARIAAQLGLADPGPPTADPVRGVSLASTRVAPGDLYAALPGARTHGARFSTQAVDGGAVAVLTDPEGGSLASAGGVPVLVVNDPRSVLGDLSALIYGHPADRLDVLAVTGTQGKTTTTSLAVAGLAGAGLAGGLIGTIGTEIAGDRVSSFLTTPEAPELHALFAVMLERGIKACAMEVSSHALVQRRVDGVRFRVAAFLNLGRDHLDYHADMAAYFAAKASLFTVARASRGLVNVDDRYGRRLVSEAEIPMVTFSAAGAEADWRATDIVAGPAGSTFTVTSPEDGRGRVQVPLPGAFNVANALAAVALLVEAGYALEPVIAGIAASRAVPGRMETVDEGQDFAALVDYAHKPDALQAVLDALRQVTRARLLVVIGAGGERDRGKRAVMGEIAARMADVVVVTDDNPRTEEPGQIRAQLLSGARASGAAVDLHEVADRRAAIELAVDLARAGDCVVVAGKGHEKGQEVAGVVHPLDDREVLRLSIQRAAAR